MLRISLSRHPQFVRPPRAWSRLFGSARCDGWCGVAALALVAVLPAAAHEPTLLRARQALRLAQAQAAATAEDPAQLRDLPMCRLKIQVTKPDAKETAPALVRVLSRQTGKAIPLPGEIHRAANWYSLAADTVVTVPQIPVTIQALRGLTTELAETEADLTGQAEAAVTLSLTRFFDTDFRGWRSGNTHLHLVDLTHEEALRYLQLVPQSDELDLVFLSHLRRIPDEVGYISNRIVEESFAGGSLGRLSQHGVLFDNGEEHRHNFGRGGEGYGHVMLLNIPRLIEPVSIGPGIMRSGTDGIPLQRGIQQARSDGATVIWCHNKFGYEDLPNWLAGLLHAQNIFDGGDHGSYEDSFYRYLNLGLRVPFSTGTDWFVYDFARVYVPIDGEFTSDQWLAELRAGRSFITNGPLLELETERAHLGDTLTLVAPNRVTFVGRGMGRLDFGGLELVYNGKVAHRVPATREGSYYAADLRHGLEIREPGWVALRIPLETQQSELGRPLFAHTSPIYVEVAGQSIFRKRVAEEMLAEIKQNLLLIAENGVFANEQEKNAVFRVHQSALEQLQKLIREKKDTEPQERREAKSDP